MVWNTTQSSLYKAVNDYNQTVEHKECSPKHITACDNTYGFKQHNQTACGELNSCNQKVQQCSQNKNTFTVQNLFADKDFLLILGLILILSKEGADSKLILALAIVLLG